MARVNEPSDVLQLSERAPQQEREQMLGCEAGVVCATAAEVMARVSPVMSFSFMVWIWFFSELPQRAHCQVMAGFRHGR